MAETKTRAFEAEKGADLQEVRYLVVKCLHLVPGQVLSGLMGSRRVRGGGSNEAERYGRAAGDATATERREKVISEGFVGLGRIGKTRN